MPLPSFLKRRPAAPQTVEKVFRRATIEWRTEAGEKIQQRALLQSDCAHGLFALMKQRPPAGSIAQVREQGSSYPVQVLSARDREEGFELALDYLLEGRRRERRVRTQGAGLLLVEGTAPVQVEVLDVSSGGMQLFSAGSVKDGASARMFGSDTNRICFVRYCIAAKGGYLIGIQFYGKDQEKVGLDAVRD